MKCKKCGSTVVLKYTTHINGELSKYWKCPVCGTTSQSTDKNKLGEVILK